MPDPTLAYGRFTAELDTTPPDTDDLLCFAEDEIKVARFARRDDLAVQRKLRVEAIESAISHMEDAKRLMLGGEPEMATQELCESLRGRMAN